MWMRQDVWYSDDYSNVVRRAVPGDEVRSEESKHVMENLRRYDEVYHRAVAFEKRRFSIKLTCDAACTIFEHQEINYLSDGNQYVHKTTPHPY